MIFLELNTHLGSKFVLNMAHVEQFRSDGTGRTVFVHSDEGTTNVVESFEEVQQMVHYALANGGVVSVKDLEFAR